MASKTWLRWLAVLPVLSLPTALAAVHEKLAAAPNGWSPVVSTKALGSRTFTVALKDDLQGLEEKLLDVSTPGSPNYGKFLSKSEVDALFPPSDEGANKVVAWLKGSGISKYRVDGRFVDFDADIATVNRVLNASYQHYQRDGASKLRTLQYSIPDDLQPHVAFVDPGTFFGRLPTGPAVQVTPTPSQATPTRRSGQGQLASNTTVSPSCQTSITPSCLKQLYNVGDYEPDPKSGSRIGFGSFLNESALYADLAQFEDFFKIPSQNFTKVIIANATDDQDPSHGGYGEANLDVQNIIGVSHPLPVTEFLTGGSPPFIPTFGQPTEADNYNEPYVPYYRYLLSRENSDLPQVISNSYGEQEDGVPRDYANTTCNLIGLLGLRGITTLFSSGDSGVGDGCLAPDFKTVEFIADFPASCPYVTAVGGNQAVPEIAWNQSSGGFSRYWDRPKWQDEAIKTYISDHVSNETYAYYGKYNNWKGRGFPDVTAHSLNPNFQVVYAGRLAGSGGTSAAAPVWAAIVGLLNDARLRAGKPQLGWLNPLIYGPAKDVLVDVTEGYSYGCQTSSGGAGFVPGARWNATAGWDPTTGFGNPDFQKLKDLVLTL